MRDTKPPRGWTASPWRPAPRADVLWLTLYLLFLESLHCALALPSCKEEEYPVDNECCPKCSPGYHVKEPCGELTGTVCVPCPPRTYTAHDNGLSECLPCRVCDPAMGLVTRLNCSRTGNTLCGCSQGHFCEDADHCAACRPHTLCRPGQRVQERGTERQDTVCQDCPPGTFSPNGSLEECQPWTECSGWVMKETEPGTSSSDVTCSFRTEPILIIIFPILICISVTTIWICIKRKPWGVFNKLRAPDARGENMAMDAPLAIPDITTVAVEETASMLTERDPKL
ncbi:tumor necrosis factor receptor superfamily member 14 isoform X1 [Otolemur garnettii]|uniref:tumor necrosis factor receptor superfamily member 14 isoform X1 n=1 Tax=Otolemur garnettii TaxID=30611 RepID=UPI0002741198|nr:tumor necrosis factor receptor superfamily member 14 isoform X1 [Otolemur garnettii]XP_023371024.1 tumor necrosis factor receptor superfamily member 14 isoform X1 [Otolemur garnettii]